MKIEINELEKKSDLEVIIEPENQKETLILTKLKYNLGIVGDYGIQSEWIETENKIIKLRFEI